MSMATESLVTEISRTAWLETTAQLLRNQRWDEIDADRLVEYLKDMACRDRRSVESRLLILIMHVLKWSFQQAHRTPSWKNTIDEQQRMLTEATQKGTLRNHAIECLPELYQMARVMAAEETFIEIEAFPEVCEYTLDSLLHFKPEELEGYNP